MSQVADPRNSWFGRMFAVDVRALAAVRIGLGVLLLTDLAIRARDLAVFYTDAGVLPRSAAGTWSIYGLVDGPLWVATLFIVAAAAAAALLLGYQTWLATALSWLLVVSLHQRNPMVINAGDHLLALLLFWGLFLPYGATASIDSRSGPRAPRVLLSVGSATLLLQIAFVYIFTAVLKSPRFWLIEATAGYEALVLDAFTRPGVPSGLLLGGAMLRLGTRTIWIIELVAPFVAFMPLRSPVPRALVSLIFIGFHIGLAVTFAIGMFPYICMVAWMAFLPTEFWDWLLCRGGARARLAVLWGRLIDSLSSTMAAVVRRVPALGSPGPELDSSTPGNVLGVLLISYCLVTNVTSLSPQLDFRKSDVVGGVFYLNQRWEMFAPRPTTTQGWWIAPARLTDRSEVDLVTGAGPVDTTRPKVLFEIYGVARWRKFLMENLVTSENRSKVPHYAGWLRRRWNDEAGPERQVREMKLIWMREDPAGLRAA